MDRTKLSQLRVKYALGIELVEDELKIFVSLQQQETAAMEAESRPTIPAQTLLPD